MSSLTSLIALNIPGAPQALHAPDGFFSMPVAIAGYLISAVIILYAVRRVNQDLSERMAPIMGVMGAFIFAAQMLNFPVAGGTSGHLVGGALTAIILGPWAAILVMTVVVGLQALLFQDGGLVVLGVNLLNMSILSVLVGYGTYALMMKGGGVLGSSRSEGKTRLTLVAGFAAAWLSVMVVAVVAAFQLALSETSPLIVALPAMAGVHALIGIGEGLITVGALAFIAAARPSLIRGGSNSPAIGEAA